MFSLTCRYSWIKRSWIYFVAELPFRLRQGGCVGCFAARNAEEAQKWGRKVCVCVLCGLAVLGPVFKMCNIMCVAARSRTSV
jgi:hypothetical protein